MPSFSTCRSCWSFRFCVCFIPREHWGGIAKGLTGIAVSGVGGQVPCGEFRRRAGKEGKD
eukprot:12351640-Alexandrium_andersonii.AAC.1